MSPASCIDWAASVIDLRLAPSMCERNSCVLDHRSESGAAAAGADGQPGGGTRTSTRRALPLPAAEIIEPFVQLHTDCETWPVSRSVVRPQMHHMRRRKTCVMQASANGKRSTLREAGTTYWRRQESRQECACSHRWVWLSLETDGMNNRKSIWILTFLALIAVPQIALGWWNDDWKFRKRLTIDATVVGAAVSAGLTEISLPVRLDAGNFAYFADLDKSGADLRFVASDDRTPLEYRIERIDTAAQLAVAWVKIPIERLHADRSFGCITARRRPRRPRRPRWTMRRSSAATTSRKRRVRRAMRPPMEATPRPRRPGPRCPVWWTLGSVSTPSRR